MLDLFSAHVSRLNEYTVRPDARRFETWETNYTTRVGLRAAADYALGIGLSTIESRCKALTQMTREALNAINGVTLHDIGSRHSAIISFTLENMESSSAMKKLHERGINVSVSNPCSTPMDADERRLPPIVRVSPHYYNSEDEIGMFASAVGDIALS